MMKVLHGSGGDPLFKSPMRPLPAFCWVLSRLSYLYECIQQADCALPENSSPECK